MAPAPNPDCWLPEVLVDIVENPEDEQEGANPTGPERVPHHPQQEVWEHVGTALGALLILWKQWWFIRVDERDLRFKSGTDESSVCMENPCLLTDLFEGSPI